MKKTATHEGEGAPKHAGNKEVPPGESPHDRFNGRGRRLGKRDDIQSLALLKSSTIAIYQDFYKEIFKGGALDRKTKELIAIAAASISGCEGCLVGHIRKARALGATSDEIKESVAVAFAVNAATVVDRTDVAAAMVKNATDEPAGKKSEG